MNKENKLLKIVKGLIYLSFFTPLILGPFGITLSAYPKAVFFRTVIEIALIFYLFLIYFYPKYIPKISLLVLSVIIFIAVLFLSAILGFNFERSFFGTPDRGEGLILHIHFLVFFLMIIGVFQKRSDWINLLRLAFIVSSLSSFAGILQKIGIFGFYGNSLPVRISGTLANPDFFGAYMSLSIFLGLIIFSLEKERDYKFFWGALIAVNFFTLIWSYTRAAWLGFLIGLLLFFFLLASKYSNLSVKQRRFILYGILIVVFLAFLAISNYQKLGLDRYYLFQRFLSSFDIVSSSRYTIWQIAVNVWEERPILGWGPESFGYLFDKNLKAGQIPRISELYYDYPHNKFLGILSDAGILGILSYLFIFTVAFYVLFKNIKSGSSLIIRFSLVVFLIVYLIQNIFAFDTIAIYFILFLVLGFIQQFFAEEKDSLFQPPAHPTVLKLFLVCVLSVFLLTAAWQVNIKPTIASFYYVKALKLGSTNTDFEEILTDFKKAINYSAVLNKDINMEVARVLVFFIESGRAQKSQKEAVNFLWSLRDNLGKTLEKPNIKPINRYELLAKIHEIYYLDININNSEILSKAEEILNKAMIFNSNHPRIYRLMGEIKILQNRYKEGEDYFRRAYELGTKEFNTEIAMYRNIGRAYSLAKNNQKAIEKFKISIDKSFSFHKINPNYFGTPSYDNENEALFWERIALTYCKDLKDVENCYNIYNMAIEVFPQYKKILQDHLNQLKNSE